MIRHLVLWSATDKAKAEGLEKVGALLNDSAKTMEGKIKGLLKTEVRMNIAATEPHQFILYSEFADFADIAPYKNHPLHLAHRERCAPWVTNREGIDIEG